MMRYGFTTGSCAAAASKAAAYMLLTGKLKQNITMQTPKGILFQTEILEISRSEQKLHAQYEKMVEMIPILHPGHSFFPQCVLQMGRKKYRGRITDNFQAFM